MLSTVHELNIDIPGARGALQPPNSNGTEHLTQPEDFVSYLLVCDKFTFVVLLVDMVLYHQSSSSNLDPVSA